MPWFVHEQVETKMGYLVFYMVAVLALATTHGIQGNLSFSLSSSSNSFADDYQRFVRAVRERIRMKMFPLYGISTLRKNIPNSERFLSLDLDIKTVGIVTLAIDMKSVGVVAYCANNMSYMFRDAPREAYKVVFPTVRREFLDLNTDYESMEIAAGSTRMETILGLDPLERAVSNLFHNRQEFLPESFLVITQMLLEPLKFKFIEQSVLKSMRGGYNFQPSLAMISLENNWAKLSSQIQVSISLQGLFGTVVDLYNSNDEIIQVDGIHNPIIRTNIALMQYHCHFNKYLVERPDVWSPSDSCYVPRRTTRISGRDGLCVGVESSIQSLDDSPVVLSPCGQQVNQKWRFQSDGTIRALEKCLTLDVSNSVVISNCSKVEPSSRRWRALFDGTITHCESGLVLTADASTGKTKLTMEANSKAFGQGWRVGSYVEPIISSIIGLQDMCVEATNKNTNVWLEKCVKNNKAEQSWAIYGDGTIRVNSDRDLCVSSPIDGSAGLVSILRCAGSANQRWVFYVYDRIMNPKTGMMLGVERGDVSLKRIILHPATATAEDEWTLFY